MLNLQWKNIWTDEELYKLQISTVSKFLKCEDQYAVEAAVEFAKYLNYKGLNSDNYPLFMEMLREENHNVTDALIGDSNAFDFFKQIQPSYYLIDYCFKLLYQYYPGGVYDKTLEIIFGILYRNYHRAKEGYKLYPLTIENLNSLAKFLDKSKKQTEGVNRFILDILGDIAEYTSRFGDEADEEINKIAAHAIAIRNAFFDRRLDMSNVLPEEILVRKDYKKSAINPRKRVPFKDTKK